MSATIAELASRLKLSKGSVSRILNHKGAGFSEETRRRVFAVADEIGYRPNPVARALATGRTGFVGFWAHDLQTAYHASVAREMEAQLERNGYRVLISLYGKLYNSSLDAPSPLVGPDGIIAHEVWGEIWDPVFGSLKGNIPIVTTGVWDAPQSIDHVGIDLAPASLEAIRHLVSSGRRRIAYLTDDVACRLSDDRYLAYCSVMTDSDLPVEFIETSRQDRASVRMATRAYFEAHGHPEAIFTHNDDAAIATYRAICDLGLSIPGDVALVSCDGIEDTEYMPVPITTIVQPLGVMCATASRFLEQRLAEPDSPPQRTILAAQLSLRESSRS